MSELLTGTTADGTEYQFDIDLCTEIANEKMGELLDLEGEVENFDFGCAMFTMFVNSIHVLSDYGWTPSQLIREVLDHTEQEHLCADCAEELAQAKDSTKH